MRYGRTWNRPSCPRAYDGHLLGPRRRDAPVGLAIWIGVRLKERRRWQQAQDISPEWLVENSYAERAKISRDAVIQMNPGTPTQRAAERFAPVAALGGSPVAEESWSNVCVERF